MVEGGLVVFGLDSVDETLLSVVHLVPSAVGVVPSAVVVVSMEEQEMKL